MVFEFIFALLSQRAAVALPGSSEEGGDGKIRRGSLKLLVDVCV